MLRVTLTAVALMAVATAHPSVQSNQPARPLKIIAFGAHPDDAELKASGVAAMWAAAGHKVKFVSMTNGDVGHFESAGGPLAKRRKAEVAECAKILGIQTDVLDIHDGELVPSLENRQKVARLIRDWQADIVMGHRPYDYHPDHRYTGVLLNDTAVVVVAPFFVPDTPPTTRNPVYMNYSDGFQDPKPFTPTIVVLLAGAHAAQRAAGRSGARLLPARDRQEAQHRRRRAVPRAADCALRGRARQEDPVRGGLRVESVRAPGLARRAEADVPRHSVAGSRG
jgi:LmbE family N-acetylglucosaminyl deacetylase